MPKGKKYNAAEKHFIEKEQRYQRQIKRLNEYIAAQDLEIARLKVALEERDKEILLQTDWINRLLEYTELNKEDIKAACEKDKRYSDAFDVISIVATAEGRGMSCLF